MPKETHDGQWLQAVMQNGAERYFERLRSRVVPFTLEYYRYPGAWRINKVAIGWDILRAPINLLWAPIYVIFQGLAWCLKHLKLGPVARLLARTPSGIPTQLQRVVRQKLEHEMFGCRDGKWMELEEDIELALQEALVNETGGKHSQQLRVLFEEREEYLQQSISKALEQYGITRTATSDITNTLVGTAVGALVFKKFTPGGLGLGILAAYIIERKMAESSFIFGDTLGRVYYRVFPPEPSLALLTSSTIAVLCVFAVFASLSGLFTDPLQTRLGLHQYRLHKMINGMEKDFNQKLAGNFRPKDQYVARVLEIVDAIKTQAF